MSNKILLEPGKYYHLYNHAIGNEVLFRSPADYHGFITKYEKYITPMASTIAYCLMPNHFHFCLRIFELEEMKNFCSKYLTNDLISTGIYRSFSHFFNSYAQAYNRKYKRMGGLFISNFKRKVISTDDDLRRLVYYIHNNPVESGFTENIDKWSYSSYTFIISQYHSSLISLDSNVIIRVFDDIDNFIFFHTHPSRV